MRLVLAAALMAALLLPGCNQASESTATSAPASGGSFAPTAEAAAAAGPTTTIAFAKLSHSFGKIAEGETVDYTFTFRNSGTEPLTITAVKPSCGCTASDYTKTPVAPGQEGYVKVQFDSKGRPGTVQKTVDVFANTNPQVTTLNFTGEVVAAATGTK